MVPGPDQSNELSVLDGDGGSISPDFPQDILKDWLYNKSILIIQCLDNAVAHLKSIELL